MRRDPANGAPRRDWATDDYKRPGPKFQARPTPPTRGKGIDTGNVLQPGCAHICIGADATTLFTDKEALAINISFFKGRTREDGDYTIDTGFNSFAGFEKDLSLLLSLRCMLAMRNPPYRKHRLPWDQPDTANMLQNFLTADAFLRLKEAFVLWRVYTEFYKTRETDLRFGGFKQVLQGSGPGSEAWLVLCWLEEEVRHRQELLGAGPKDRTGLVDIGALAV